MTNWLKIHQITRFKASEFPEDPERCADVFFLRELNAFAIKLKAAVFPSPAPGALCRFDGSKTSRHYAVERRADACDVFCNCSIGKAWTTAIQRFSGVGVYFDTHFRGGPWPMLHLDMRPEALLWYRQDGIYHYQGEPDFYFHLFNHLDKPIKMGKQDED